MRECFEKAGDLSALMLLLMSTGDSKGLKNLTEQAGTCSPIYSSVEADTESHFLTEEKGLNNLAFACRHQVDR